MGVYRQKYEDWFNALNETERKAETARMNSSKTMRKAPATKVAGATAVQEPPKIVNVPSNVTPAGPAFSLANLTPVMVQPQMSMMQQPVTMQVIPTTGKDRQQVIMITFLVKSISQNSQPNVFRIIFPIFFLLISYSFWMIS